MLERLSALVPMQEIQVAWGDMRLRRLFYLTREAPPLSLTTSARAVVFRGARVLVIRGVRGDAHVLPGGRREAGETLEATLRREVLEELGWSLAAISPLGILHFRHLTSAPPDYPYPFPDFLQAVFTAEGAAFNRRAIVRDGWEANSKLVSQRLALNTLDDDQRDVLHAAIDARRTAS